MQQSFCPYRSSISELIAMQFTIYGFIKRSPGFYSVNSNTGFNFDVAALLNCQHNGMT